MSTKDVPLYMPQFNQPTKFIPPDSLHLDTIWLNYNDLPAKRFNPVDTPELVFFHVDSAIAHLVRWDHVDTVMLHHMERKDTVVSKSIFNISKPGSGQGGAPLIPSYNRFQLGFSAVVLLLFFAILSTIINTNKSRIQRYFLSIFSTRKFKDYFLEEHPGLWPTTPIIYTMQGLIAGSTVAIWLASKTMFNSPVQYGLFCLAIIGGFMLVPLFRNVLIITLGNIFMIQQDARKHVFISYLTHSFLTMLLLPLAVMQAIQLESLNLWMDTVMLSCMAMAVGYQLVKLIQNTSLPDIGSFIYIFLYFCTLELLPLLLIYKVVSLTTIT